MKKQKPKLNLTIDEFNSRIDEAIDNLIVKAFEVQEEVTEKELARIKKIDSPPLLAAQSQRLADDMHYVNRLINNLDYEGALKSNGLIDCIFNEPAGFKMASLAELIIFTKTKRVLNFYDEPEEFSHYMILDRQGKLKNFTEDAKYLDYRNIIDSFILSAITGLEIEISDPGYINFWESDEHK